MGRVRNRAGDGKTAGRICTKQELEETFEALCEYSVHSHQQELRQGYISTRSGCRAGVAGTTVVEGGRVVSMRSITSLCIRVARPHPGCAASLARALTDSRGRVHSALLCGEPSSGKSSLLRDLARQLSQGLTGRRYRVSVIDERGELSGVPEAPGQASLRNCDVLLYCPKPAGIGQAVRCLAPDVLLFDELGVRADPEAVCQRYEEQLVQGHFFVPGAQELLEALHTRYELYLATNGTPEVQNSRIESAGIARYFQNIFISEQMGAYKPSPAFFQACFRAIPDFDPAEALMVGDSLTSDIRGARNVGLRSCWYNPQYLPPRPDIPADYTIGALPELPPLLERL